ncbi:phage capsid protein, partial [Burkholderia cepacia]
QRFSDLSQSVVALAESQGQVLEQLEKFNANFDELKRAQQDGDKRHSDLVVKLSRTDSSTQQRPTSTGSDNGAQTDC